MEIILSKLRKMRVKKEKDKLSSLINLSIIIIMASLVIVSMIVISTKSDSDEINIPNERPDIIGEVREIYSENILVQTMIMGNNSISPNNVENITIKSKTQIFWMNRRDDTTEKASRSDIQIGSRVAVWGERDFDGTWHARDIGIMKMRAPRQKPMQNGN